MARAFTRRLGFLLASISTLVAQSCIGVSAQPVAAKNDSKKVEKFALLIGIDDYSPKKQNKDDNSDQVDLNGCNKDVNDIRNLLVKSFDFKNDDAHIKVLRDTDATSDAIVEAFKTQLIKNAKTNPNGVFVFHYSGHGASDLPDFNKDEEDGKDECIVGADLRPVVDDQIAGLIKELTDATSDDANITTIFDCCHSGTPTRDATGLTYRQLKSENLKLDRLRSQQEQAGSDTEGAGNSLSIVPMSTKKVIAVSACTSIEKEPETNEKDISERNGVLTRSLMEILSKEKPGSSYRDLREKLNSAVTAKFGTHPQIMGDIDRVVLSGDSTKNDPWITIKEVGDGFITIDAGKAQALQVGGVVAVYDASATKLSGSNKLLAQGTIDQVDGLTSKILLDNKVPQNSKVIIVTPNFGAKIIGVALDDTLKKAGAPGKAFEDGFSKLVAEKKGVAIRSLTAAAPDGWDVKVVADTFAQFSKGAARTGGADQNKRTMGGSSKPAPGDLVLFVASRDEQPLFNYYIRANDKDASAQILKTIEQSARQQAVLSISNDTGSPLNDAVKVEVVRVLDHQAVPPKTEKKPEDQNGHALFKPEDKFMLELTNNGKKPVFASVLLIGTQGGITQLYKGSDGLEPGVTMKSDILIAEGPLGVDTYKVIVTSKPVDFSFLESEDVTTRSLDETTASGLPQMLFDGTTRTRSVRKLTPPAPDEWGVFSFVSEVHG